MHFSMLLFIVVVIFVFQIFTGRRENLNIIVPNLETILANNLNK